MKLDSKKRHSLLVWGMGGSIVGLLAIVFMIFIDGRFFLTPIRIESPLELKTVKDTYKVGEVVQVYFTFCKNRNIEGFTQWYITDGVILTFPRNTTTNIIKGCYTDKIVDIERIPPLIDLSLSDKFRFEGAVNYKINFLNHIIVPLRTTSFRIVN